MRIVIMKLPSATALALACALPAAAAPAMPACEMAEPAGKVRTLSAAQQQGLLEGRGMGMARAADLNGYPGPKHVLELAAELELSEDQRQRTEALLAAMQADAQALGAQLVEEERKLDRLFADGLANRGSMLSILNRVSSLQGSLRARHLEAHLAQRDVLDADQLARYRDLRAETHGGEPGMHRMHHGGDHGCDATAPASVQGQPEAVR